jgi:dTDP-4-amino-4,6-dideoxygalactose transaminase
MMLKRGRLSMASQHVPFLDLSRIHKPIQQELEDAILRVVRSGHYILGPEVERFEKEMAEYCEVKHAIGVANGTDALELALRAVGVNAGYSVLVPAFTFVATASAVCAIGARPVFGDIDENFLLDWYWPGLAAEIPVSLYGHKCVTPPADKGNVPCVEDIAQGIGLPVTGDAACLSFFPTKNLGCMGDSGAVLTNRDDVAEQVRLLRVHGARTKYHHEVVGRNSRLDAIQAAILLVKLRYLDEWTARRGEIAGRYSAGMADYPRDILCCPGRTSPHVWNQYTVRIGNGRRDEIKKKLAEAGIDTMIYYPEPLHLQPAFKHLGYREGDFPEAERACKEVLSLPIYPGLTDKEQDYVIEELKKALDENN